jgi:hypothetical protein
MLFLNLGVINLKLIKFILILGLCLIALVACSKTEKSNGTFIGESEHWTGELVQNGKVIYRNHPELENHYEIEYEKKETLTITYKGDVSELGNEVSYSYRSKLGGSKNGTKSDDGLTMNVFTSQGVSNGVSHLPQDMKYNPINRKDKPIEVVVTWQGKEEVIKLQSKN